MLLVFADFTHQLLYSRLLQCKEICLKLAVQDPKRSMFNVNPVAKQLGLVDTHGSGAVLARAAGVPTHPHQDHHVQRVAALLNVHSTAQSQQEGVPVATMPSTAVPRPQIQMSHLYQAFAILNRPEAHFYGYLLDACEKLFEGEMDQATFEENMRFLFGTKVRFRVIVFSSIWFYASFICFFFTRSVTGGSGLEEGVRLRFEH